jgi:hypothetical protein
MGHPNEFYSYRVKVVRIGEPLVANLPRFMWWKLIRIGVDTEYRGDVLRRRYGERWPVVLGRLAADRSLDIRGSDDGRSWFPVSTWRPPSEPAARRGSATELPKREAERERMRKVLAQIEKQPSRGAAAWHLKRQGFTRDQVIKTMQELGWLDVNSRTLGDHLKYGRRLEDEAVPCPFDAVP